MKGTTLGFVCAVGLSLLGQAYGADLTAIADTYTQSSTPTANFGSSGIVAVANGRITLIRFNPTAVAQSTGGSATLKVKVLVAKNSTNAVSVRLVQSAWNEGSVTFATLPTISAASIDQKTITPANVGQIVTFDLSSVISAWRTTPSSNFGIALVSAAPIPNLQLGSREGGSPATLSITTQVTADNDVTVAVTGGDYTSLAAAAANARDGDKWCQSTSASTRCTIHVQGGIYVDSSQQEPIEIPTFVDVIGAGKGESIVFASLALTGDSLLSDLTLNGSISRSPSGAPLRLTDLSVLGRLAFDSGAITVTDSEIGDTVGCVGCVLKLIRSQISARSNDGAATGISFIDGPGSASTLDMQDSSVFVWGATEATGIESSDEFSPTLTIRNSKFAVVSSGVATGMSFHDNAHDLQVIGTVMDVQGGTNGYGIRWAAFGDVILDGSTIRATDSALEAGTSGSGQEPQVSVLRAQLLSSRGNSLAAFQGANVNIEDSIVRGVTIEGGNLTATSSQIGGQVLLQDGATGTCTRVFDGNLALRPANCTGP